MNSATNHKISIITIVYNGETLIEQTIQSVIQQKNVALEYIIVDGASTDHTLKIISKYQDRIDHVISEPDKGIYDAINKGIKVAKNEVIGLIHCGDFYEPNALSAVMEAFDKTSADVLYGDIHMIENLSGQSVVHRHKADHTRLGKKMSIFHPSTFISRKCYLNHGPYHPDYKITADYHLLLSLYLKNAKFTYIPKVLANFSCGGISGTHWNRLVKENVRIRKTLLGTKSAFYYLATTLPVHYFYTLRKSMIELIIGKQNFIKLKLYYSGKRDQTIKTMANG